MNIVKELEALERRYRHEGEVTLSGPVSEVSEDERAQGDTLLDCADDLAALITEARKEQPTREQMRHDIVSAMLSLPDQICSHEDAMVCPECATDAVLASLEGKR